MLLLVVCIVCVLIFFIYSRIEKYEEKVTHLYKEQILKLDESENRFRLLYEQAPTAYQSLDYNGNLLMVNFRWREELGYTKDEVIGKNIIEFLRPEDIPLFAEIFSKFIEAGEISNSEFKLVCKDGTIIDVVFFGKVIYDESGKFSYSQCSFTDITEQKRLQEKFEFNQNYLQSIFDVTKDIMITSDGEGIDRANPAMLEFTGHKSLEDFKNNHECICDLFLEDKLCLQAQMGEEGWLEYVLARPEQLHKVYMLKGNKRHRFIVWAKKLYLDDRNRSVISFNDITQLEEIKERYEYAIYGAEDGLWDWNMVKNTVYYSPRWKAMLGLEDDEITDDFKEFESRVHSDDIPKLVSGVQKHIQEGVSYSESIRVRHKDGTWVWILTRGKVVEYSLDGEPIRMVGTHSDITKRKELERKLVASRLEFDMFMHYIPASILIKDIDGVIIYANKSANDFFQQNSLVGKKAQDLLPSDKVKETDLFAQKVIQMGQYENINEFYNAKNEKVIVRSLGFKIVIEDSVQIGLVIVDITQSYLDKKALDDKEEIMITQSRHAAMGEMISMIAHQWRQPISVIAMGANNILADIELDILENETLKNGAKDILNQTQELSKTIDDFRNFFKPGKFVEEILPEDIFIEASSVIGKSLENNNIELITDFKNTKKISTYSRELMQVLINILKNSKEALIEKRDTKREIVVQTRDVDGYISIEICDNAGGIDDKILDKIFDPYFTTKSKTNGTGLGLYISKTIVEKHLNGSIEVYNKDGDTCFKIKIPYRLEQ